MICKTILVFMTNVEKKKNCYEKDIKSAEEIFRVMQNYNFKHDKPKNKLFKTTQKRLLL